MNASPTAELVERARRLCKRSYVTRTITISIAARSFILRRDAKSLVNHPPGASPWRSPLARNRPQR